MVLRHGTTVEVMQGFTKLEGGHRASHCQQAGSQEAPGSPQGLPRRLEAHGELYKTFDACSGISIEV